MLDVAALQAQLPEGTTISYDAAGSRVTLFRPDGSSMDFSTNPADWPQTPNPWPDGVSTLEGLIAYLFAQASS